MRSEQRKSIAGSLGLLLGLSLANVALGQAPPPPAPVPTIWDKLGVTGFHNCLESKLVNPHGNHPGLEKKPLLKKIADPANLQSDNPAIKAAAQVKQQEDLAPQKIKAIKYLATMGCGCYQKTVDVRGALLAALEDCTEEVRFEAATALYQVAGNPCAQCDGTCCNAETMNKLQEHASGKTASGCYKESSERVRQMSQYALDACRRKLPPGSAETPPITPPTGEHPILPPAPSGEHPSGLRELPAPVPPLVPQPIPAPETEPKKPLEVPAEPPTHSADHSYRAVPAPASAAPPLASPTTSSVVILDVKPVAYETGKVRTLPARNDRAAERPAKQPHVVLRLVIPGDK
jgi:hypothetical protein